MSNLERASRYFEQKYHCSQSVLAAFAEELGLTEKQALKLGGCFGAGMCKGEVCGACVGALMVLGLKYGQCEIDDIAARKKANELTDVFLEEFQKENGSYICRELLKCDIATKEGREYAREHNLFTAFCPKMVCSAVEIVERIMNEGNICK